MWAAGQIFWDAVRGNLAVLADAKRWWTVVQGPLTPLIEDAALCRQAAQLLPPEPWDGETWPAVVCRREDRYRRQGQGSVSPAAGSR